MHKKPHNDVLRSRCFVVRRTYRLVGLSLPVAWGSRRTFSSSRGFGLRPGREESGGATLLVAIFASNLPEAVVGAEKMRAAGMERRTIMLIWAVTAVVLALAVVAGYGAFSGVSDRTLAWPLGFAGGAVLASLADTLMPEAFEEARHRPSVAYFTALGFLLSFLVSAT